MSLDVLHSYRSEGLQVVVPAQGMGAALSRGLGAVRAWDLEAAGVPNATWCPYWCW